MTSLLKDKVSLLEEKVETKVEKLGDKEERIKALLSNQIVEDNSIELLQSISLLTEKIKDLESELEKKNSNDQSAPSC